MASFSEERLTDAPYELLASHLRDFARSKHLRFAAPFAKVQEGTAELRLTWRRARIAAIEEGLILARPDERGAYLRLEGRLSGWGCLLFLGKLRWHSDGLLERIVEEL